MLLVLAAVLSLVALALALRGRGRSGPLRRSSASSMAHGVDTPGRFRGPGSVARSALNAGHQSRSRQVQLPVTTTIVEPLGRVDYRDDGPCQEWCNTGFIRRRLWELVRKAVGVEVPDQSETSDDLQPDAAGRSRNGAAAFTGD
jgi:hypothetical protein